MKELQDSYKDTKIGRIPKDWEVISISELGKISTSSVDKKSKVEETEVSLINYMDVFGSLNKKITGAIDFMSVTARNTQLIKSQVKKGDVLFTPSSETKKDIGISAVVYEDLPKTLFSYHLLRLSFTKDLNLNFKCYLFNSETVLKQFELLSQGLTRYTIGLGNFNEIFIPIPSLPEQQKIADILSTVDEQISTTDKIIEKSKELKKGLMQKFFLNKAFMIMSLGETEETELKPIRFNEIGKILTGTTPPTAKQEYYNSKDYMFIGPADMGGIRDIKSSNKYISQMGFEVARKLPTDAIMVVCIGATIGKIGLTIEPCATNQQVNTIVSKEEYSTRYLYYLISGLKKYLLAFAGDTATPQLKKTDFGKVVTFIHTSKSERTKIAAILSEADAKIEKEQSQKTQLENLKKGLMQQLLTGKKRVTI